VIYDPIVRATKSKYDEYLKDAFRGARSSPTFREGQPIRWRDGGWELKRSDKKGAYELTLPISVSQAEGKNGKPKSVVDRTVLVIIPDGPSMFGWMKRLTDESELADGSVKQCDARVVYSDRKKQWFVKLTGRFSYTQPEPGSRVAAMRRGVNNAFVIVFDDGYCRTIEGGDVIAFKKKIKARTDAIRRHLKSLELGSGARGHGKKRREAGITRIHDSESRFVDTRCKTWAASVAKLLKHKNVGTLLVAKANSKEFFDSVDDEEVAAFLHQWPFAKAFDLIKKACEVQGIVVKADQDVGFNARRCPQCGFVHAKRQTGSFICEVCRPEFKRPADQILAWNMLLDAVGKEPLNESRAAEKAFRQAVRKGLKPSKDNKDAQ
jgi:transposase